MRTTRTETIDINSKDIPDLYQVKYRIRPEYKGAKFADCPEKDLSQWQYGIVEQYSAEAKKLWRQKKVLIIEDAILPIDFPIQLSVFEVVAIPLTMDNFKTSDYAKYVDAEFKKAMKKHNSSKTLVGKMFSMGVGDGCAYYVITKASKTKVNVEWRGFSADRYHDQFLSGGGSFAINQVQHLIPKTWETNIWKPLSRIG
jgi:hypothetical protein